MDDEMDKQYGNNLTNIIFSILNIAGYSIVFLFAICLQFMRNKGIIGIPPVSSVVPVYPGAYPAPVYDAPYGKNIPYQNVVPGSGSIWVNINYMKINYIYFYSGFNIEI